MNKTKNRPPLRFRNATVDEQIITCERFAIGLKKLPPEKRGRVPVHELQQMLEEAVDVRAALAEHRFQARVTLTKQKQVMVRLREQATVCADWLNAQVAGDPLDLLAAGLRPAKSKRIAVGLPSVPMRLRATHLPSGVSLRWRSARFNRLKAARVKLYFCSRDSRLTRSTGSASRPTVPAVPATGASRCGCIPRKAGHDPSSIRRK
jgi:hypothetical protein